MKIRLDLGWKISIISVLKNATIVARYRAKLVAED